MLLFPTGIRISTTEYSCLLHITPDPEQWLVNTLENKAQLRKRALVEDWRPRLFADPLVSSLPVNADDLVQLIVNRYDYKTRVQIDAKQNPSAALDLHNTQKFNQQSRTGATVILCPQGITISEADQMCLLAYVKDISDWVIGALLGEINRGKKKMIRQYWPVIMADRNVESLPANEDDLIQVIVQLDDYTPLI